MTVRSRGHTFTALRERDFAWFLFGNLSFFMAMQMGFLVRAFMAFDLTDPEKPRFLDYVNRRNFDEDVSIEDEDENKWPNPAAGDLSMEGLLFISAKNSPTKTPLIVAAHEVSGTTTIFEINVR